MKIILLFVILASISISCQNPTLKAYTDCYLKNGVVVNIECDNNFVWATLKSDGEDCGCAVIVTSIDNYIKLAESEKIEAIKEALCNEYGVFFVENMINLTPID